MRRSRTKVAPLPGMVSGSRLRLLRFVLNAKGATVNKPKWAAPSDVRYLESHGYITVTEMVTGKKGRQRVEAVWLSKGKVVCGSFRPTARRLLRAKNPF